MSTSHADGHSNATASPGQPSEASTPPTRFSRIAGALLALHAGDSLGASLEFSPWASVRTRYPNGLREIIGGGPFNWPPGHATDDTDLTRAVLLAYRDQAEFMTGGEDAALDTPPAYKTADGGFDVVRAAADYMVQWNQGNWPGRQPGSRPVDIGNATVIGLGRYKQSRDPRNAGAGPGQAGNGSLMRCLPTGLFVGDRARRIKESEEISGVTHNDRRCTASCTVYNEIVASLVGGLTPDAALERAEVLVKELDCKPVEEAVKRGRSISLAAIAQNGPGVELPGKAGGFVLESLILAVAAVLDPRPLADVLVDVVRVGSDTDTNGAIAGGLLGARDGVEAVPLGWKQKLQFRSEFEDVVRRILELDV
ncbi:ADP-ribosylglycohydrolase family protein [Lepidopterella palustris CBS 459.81]|uniref:ADP-ribosylhydrolase ARH3 n=1 Tax=Lepidopterella palustris CBS 459.81 TaxID=1314670 RepID=A0A8E2E362_9PEZI|nr:ADP-ribosylglycohydrolase family protein [Lepidopterella palustris CBS 459.81]